jgi:low affinity Fe/Cu permease
MTPDVPAALGGVFASGPGLVGALLAVLLVILVGRVVLSVAWRLVVVALGVSVVVWLLGAVGLSPV